MICRVDGEEWFVASRGRQRICINSFDNQRTLGGLRLYRRCLWRSAWPWIS